MLTEGISTRYQGTIKSLTQYSVSQMSSLLHLKWDSAEIHGYFRSLRKLKPYDYSRRPLELGVKLSDRPHHETFLPLNRSEDADCGWWIPKLI